MAAIGCTTFDQWHISQWRAVSAGAAGTCCAAAIGYPSANISLRSRSRARGARGGPNIQTSAAQGRSADIWGFDGEARPRGIGATTCQSGAQARAPIFSISATGLAPAEFPSDDPSSPGANFSLPQVGPQEDWLSGRIAPAPTVRSASSRAAPTPRRPPIRPAPVSPEPAATTAPLAEPILNSGRGPPSRLRADSAASAARRRRAWARRPPAPMTSCCASRAPPAFRADDRRPRSQRPGRRYRRHAEADGAKPWQMLSSRSETRR